MLKTETRFHLDRSYNGPFQIKSPTSTNALKDDTNVEELNVSCQWLPLDRTLRKVKEKTTGMMQGYHW